LVVFEIVVIALVVVVSGLPTDGVATVVACVVLLIAGVNLLTAGANILFIAFTNVGLLCQQLRQPS